MKIVSGVAAVALTLPASPTTGCAAMVRNVAAVALHPALPRQSSLDGEDAVVATSLQREDGSIDEAARGQWDVRDQRALFAQLTQGALVWQRSGMVLRYKKDRP